MNTKPELSLLPGDLAGDLDPLIAVFTNAALCRDAHHGVSSGLLKPFPAAAEPRAS
jgi:hypothetical protein